MTGELALAVLAGALFGGGLLLLVVALRGVRPRPGKPPGRGGEELIRTLTTRGAVAAVAAVLILLGVTLLLTRGGRVWPIFLVPAWLLVVLLLTAHFVVIAGPRGFVVRSALGWPRLSIPAAELAKAGATTVDPMADFGGWGFRWVIGPGRKGRWRRA